MLAARMHEYHKPLILEQVQEAKNLSGENVLVKVGGAGICRTDLQMIDGYFRGRFVLFIFVLAPVNHHLFSNLKYSA